jgi:Xaa-Pro aminopeptidase
LIVVLRLANFEIPLKSKNMNRIEKLKALLEEKSLDAVLITYVPNIRYLSGFSGSSASVLITKSKNFFITDFRYKDQSHNEVHGFEIIINYAANDELKKIVESEGIKTIGFEASRMTYGAYDNNKNNFPGVNFVPLTDVVEKLTMSKTIDELAKIQKACDISDKVFAKMLSVIKPGMKELDLSAEITYAHKKLGALKDSFEPIVASGWRAALPHGIATNKVIEKGDIVTLDFGCVYDGFCSDITRTIAVGDPGDELKKIYSIVYNAQLKAIDAARSGISSKSVDSVARDFITSHGHGENFGHGLGHGLGIEVHEMPGLSQRMDITLAENSVVTIEPGIYVEGLGGVRIEDDVTLKPDGCLVMNRSPKELIII